jgi:hypothetical protein
LDAQKSLLHQGKLLGIVSLTDCKGFHVMQCVMWSFRDLLSFSIRSAGTLSGQSTTDDRILESRP